MIFWFRFNWCFMLWDSIEIIFIIFVILWHPEWGEILIDLDLYRIPPKPLGMVHHRVLQKFFEGYNGLPTWLYRNICFFGQLLFHCKLRFEQDAGWVDIPISEPIHLSQRNYLPPNFDLKPGKISDGPSIKPFLYLITQH